MPCLVHLALVFSTLGPLAQPWYTQGVGWGGDVWQGAILRGTNETFWPVSMAQSVRLLPLCIFCAHAQVPVKVFARSSEARHLSLQERKQALYDYARR